MRFDRFVRAAAGGLVAALLAGGALAQTAQPTPQTMTDVAPLPASERTSAGAVILMDEPVLAQKEAMAAAQQRSAVDTTALGAGPSRVLRDQRTREQIEFERALDAAMRKQQEQGTPK
jgi:hypothetical protein